MLLRRWWQLRVYATDGLGQETEFAELGEHAAFGEMALRSAKPRSAEPRSASVSCLTEVDLLEAGRASLAQLADGLGPVAEALHGFTRERLLANLMAGSRCLGRSTECSSATSCAGSPATTSPPAPW